MNLMMLLEMAQSSFGDRVALTNGGEHLTYEQLFQASGAAGEKARSAGAEYFAMHLEASWPGVSLIIASKAVPKSCPSDRFQKP